MKITILALHLGYGGIEKFISNIANMMSENNDVEIISIYKLYEKPPFHINENVRIKYLLENLKPNREEFYESIKKFKIIDIIKQSFTAMKILYLKKHKMIEAIKNLNCDVVISTIHPHNKLVSAYCKDSIKKIATEHNYKIDDKKYINKVVNSCIKMDYLVVASKKLTEMYKEKLAKTKCTVVNIPLGVDYIPDNVSTLENKEITYIGRLSKEKGVIDLIDVFNEVAKKDNNVILNIIGDGDEKENVISKISEYNLNSRVILHGYKNKEEIEEILMNTCIGINTSYTESFGLAILELFSYGIPCVTFSSAEGVKEIINDSKDGYIIEGRNKSNMACKIVNLLNDENERKKLGKNAREKSLQFQVNKIQSYWLDLIK